MDFYIHDTKQKRKRLFAPMDPAHIKVYVCGPTVYDRVHIGNGFSAVVFDVLIRVLRVLYPKVTFVRNVTDIDDKIIAAADTNNEPYFELAQRFTDAYREDMDSIYVLPPDLEPKPTQTIEQIRRDIDLLIERGFAYEAEGHVLFQVSTFEDYGTLSRRTLKEMYDGARVEVAPYKRDPKDFVLWKPSTDNQPGWDSPWGRGRPGWHIECSAMIRHHLGPTIDIHGAGNDLIFPHNENEMAQGSCVEDGANFVNYWMHNGMLNMGGRKMSKSKGNILTVCGLIEQIPGEVVRYALLTGHYRQSLLWDDQLLQQAANSLDTLYRALRHTEEHLSPSDYTASYFQGKSVEEFPENVLTTLVDDLHTPKALAALHEIARNIHTTKDQKTLAQLRNQLLAGGWLVGLLNTPVSEYFQGADGCLDAEEIERLIEERNAARKNKDFARADDIRTLLSESGVELEDTRSGTRWSRT